jgi:hypothetical protein
VIEWPESAQRHIAFLERELQITKLDCDNAELALRAERRKVKTLEGQLRTRNDADPLRADIQEVFEDWRARCNHPRAKLGPKRNDAIKAMLRLGFTKSDLKLANLGASRTAFEKNGKRYDDIELICRNEVNVERFMTAGQAILDGKDPKPTTPHLRVVEADPMQELMLILRQRNGGKGQVNSEGEECFDCPACSGHETLTLDIDNLRCQDCGAGPRDVIAALRKGQAA